MYNFGINIAQILPAGTHTNEPVNESRAFFSVVSYRNDAAALDSVDLIYRLDYYYYCCCNVRRRCYSSPL